MNKRKNVLFISHEATIGGAARSLLELLAAVKEYVNAVVVLPQNGAMEENLAALNIKYYIIPFTSAYGKIGMHTKEEEKINFIDNYKAAGEILTIVEKEEIQLIYSNSSVCNVGAIAAIRGKIPHIWHFRELLEEDFLSEFWDKELKEDLFSVTNQFITISKCVMEKYENAYGIESECIYDAVDYQRYYSEIANKEIKGKTLNNMLIAGGITKGKGQFDAIRAVEILVSRRIKNIKLLIVGSGTRTYLWELEQYIRENKLERYIDIMTFQQDLREIRDMCIISLTCSKMEALGRVTIEAMMAGLVVIGADTGGTRELIGENGERGYLYREGDASDLADKIYKILEEKEEYVMKKRISAQEFAENTFDSHTYASKIYQQVNDCINRYEITDRIIAMGTKLEKRYNILCEKGFDSQQIDTKGNYGNIYMSLFFIMNKWFKMKCKGGDLTEYLIGEKMSRVAIYGMGYLGSNLFSELTDNSITVVCVVDKAFRNTEIPSKYIKSGEPNEIFNTVDVVILTMITNVKEIKKELEKNYSCRFFTIEELIDLCLQKNNIMISNT